MDDISFIGTTDFAVRTASLATARRTGDYRRTFWENWQREDNAAEILLAQDLRDGRGVV